MSIPSRRVCTLCSVLNYVESQEIHLIATKRTLQLIGWIITWLQRIISCGTTSMVRTVISPLQSSPVSQSSSPYSRPFKLKRLCDPRAMGVDNVGLYIASYAILGSLTNNDTAIQLSEQSAVAAMNTYVWNTPQGINKESDGESANSDDSIGFRAILIRYLHKAHPYLQDQSVKDAIVRYINIQYWALTQLSSDDINQPIRYGRNWTGPAFNISTEHAQL